MNTEQRVWLITGVSTGFGRELARAVLARGDRVVGTARNTNQVAEFNALAAGRAHGIKLDVTDRAAIGLVVDQAVRDLGQLDVVVNNAGYGLFGAVEEISDAEARQLMETNFFGLMAVTQAALPHLRSRGAGNIVNVSSVAGFMGIPGGGLYCASKYAVEGFSESLALELAPFNIHVTIVEPGGFRTNFSGASKNLAARTLGAYENTPAGKTRAMIGAYHGQEPGDPALAAKAIIDAVTAAKPPLRLVLGNQALSWARGKLKSLADNYDEWAAVSAACDAPAARPAT